MKNQRRSRRHIRVKASAGAYSDRNGPRCLPIAGGSAGPSGQAAPWLKDFPSFDPPVVTLPPAGALVRKR